MPSKKRSDNKKGKKSNFAKLSIFQPNKYKFKKAGQLIKGGWNQRAHESLSFRKKSELRMIRIVGVRPFLKEEINTYFKNKSC